MLIYINVAIYECLMKPYTWYVAIVSLSQSPGTVVDYDMSTIVCTSNNDTLSIYITHLRLVNDNYRVRCSEKGTRIGMYFRGRARSGWGFPFISAFGDELLERYCVFPVKSRYQGKSCVSTATLPFPAFVTPMEIGNRVERSRFVENYRSYARTVDVIARISSLALGYAVRFSKWRSRCGILFCNVKEFISRFFSRRQEILRNVYFICAGAEARRLREVPGTGSEEPDRQRVHWQRDGSPSWTVRGWPSPYPGAVPRWQLAAAWTRRCHHGTTSISLI